MAGTGRTDLGPTLSTVPGPTDTPSSAAPTSDPLASSSSGFQQQFGMSPDQYFAQNPNYYQPNSPTWNSPEMQYLNSSGYFDTRTQELQPGSSANAQQAWMNPNVGATAPAPISAFGPTPSVTPSYGTAALATTPGAPNAAQMAPTYASAPNAPTANTVDPNQNQGYLNYYSSLVRQQLDPTFQAQNQANEDQNKARGLTGGAAQYSTNQLAGQQAAVVAGAIQPMVGQAYSYTQQDIQGNQAAINSLMAQGYSYQEATSLANQQASNSASSSNMSAINSFLAQGYSYQQATQLANQAATNSQTGQNVGAANSAASQNAAYYGGALSADYSSYNAYMNSLLNAGANNYNNVENTYLNSYAPNAGVTGAIGNSATSVGNAYGQAYNATTAAQGQAIGGAFGAAGQVAAAGG